MGTKALARPAGVALLLLTLGLSLGYLPAGRAAGAHVQSVHDTPRQSHLRSAAPALPVALSAAAGRAQRGYSRAAAVSATTWYERAELSAADGSQNGYLGTAVALSGTIALAGAPNTNRANGAVYAFVYSGARWTQQQVITPTDGTTGSFFGQSLALSGATLVVGAPGKNSSRGAAYVFGYTGGAWTERAELHATPSVAGNAFGWSVAISGGTIVVGTLNPATPGAAYVFGFTGTKWSQQAVLTATDGMNGDLFGTAVAVSGQTALVGAYHRNNDTGAAYLFVRSGTTWTQQQEIGGAANDSLAYSVALSGSTAVLGVPGIDAADVFVRNGSSWVQQAALLPNGGEAASFGNAVALSAGTVVIGAYGTLNLTGAAYVFIDSGGSWSQQAELTAFDTHLSSYFGASVAVSGNEALIGAYGQGADGAAYVYVRN